MNMMKIMCMISAPLFRSSQILFCAAFIFTAIILLSACGSKPAEDPCCTLLTLPAGADVKDGQGAIQVEGQTNTYFYIFDKTGKQVSYQTLNKSVGLDPGKYHIKINNSTYPVEIKEGMLAKCSTGTLKVNGTTSEYYYVLDSTNQQLSYDGLGKATSLFASTFRVKVNNTSAPAQIKLNELTEIQSGTLLVHGTTGEYYYVLDEMGNQLNYNTLEKPLAFLPGSYTVKVNNTTVKTEIAPGKLTELKTGTVLVKGLTNEYYYATDSLGNQLNYQTLNKPLAFFPGTIKIKVNNTETHANVVKGQTSEYTTGSVMVTGNGKEYYYVLDQTGNQLNYNSLNKSLSFFPSEYTLKLGQQTRKATVTAGQLTTTPAFK